MSVVPCYVPCGKWETVGIDSPWSARLGSGLEGVAQFSTLVLEEYFRELETVRNAKKKWFQIWQKLASRSWPQHTVAVAMHDRDCDRFCSFNGAAYVFFWFALTGCDRKFAAAMRHMVCDRLMCRSRCLSSVVEMGVCFLEVAGLDCSYVLYAWV